MSILDKNFSEKAYKQVTLAAHVPPRIQLRHDDRFNRKVMNDIAKCFGYKSSQSFYKAIINRPINTNWLNVQQIVHNRVSNIFEGNYSSNLRPGEQIRLAIRYIRDNIINAIPSNMMVSGDMGDSSLWFDLFGGMSTDKSLYVIENTPLKKTAVTFCPGPRTWGVEWDFCIYRWSIADKDNSEYDNPRWAVYRCTVSFLPLK